MVLSCKRWQGLKLASRKGAKEDTMVNAPLQFYVDLILATICDAPAFQLCAFSFQDFSTYQSYPSNQR